jgi:hypothetical protein
MQEIRKIFGSTIDSMLLERLMENYQKIKQNFWLGKDEECLEKTGKFVEIIIRIIQQLTSGEYTSFEEELKISECLKSFERLPKDRFPESIRILIPRVLYTLYTFRSKRGGAHVKGINPNHIDATYVISACDWIIAELIRLYHSDDEKEIRKIIDSVVDRKVPILEEFEDDIKILDTSLSVPDKILVILYKKYPSYVSINDLKKWIKVKDRRYINTALKRLDERGLIHRKSDNSSILTRTGIKYVEDKLQKEIW